MKNLCCAVVALLIMQIGFAQSPVGKWKQIASTVMYEGKPMDVHAALMKIRPCAANIIYDISADGNYRLDAASSGCDDNYKKMQQKLYSKTKWKLDGNKLSISATKFAVSQIYMVVFSGNKMTCTGTEGQGVTVYQRL